MSFRITGLDQQPFAHLFELNDEQLAQQGAKRIVADSDCGYPDRIELRDAKPGESLLLLNYEHQPADTPYRASHAIYILEGATKRFDRADQVPSALRSRTLSVRAFNQDHELIDAGLVEGAELESCVQRLHANAEAAYLHAHYARFGCYAARIDRV